MKLTDMKVELIKIPLKKPFRIAFAVQEHSVNVLVKLITDEGVWGIGEAAPFEPVTGENANTVMEALKLFKQGLLGRDPMDLEGIHQMMDNLISGNTAAKAAVDIALYDIRGKVMGQPLYKVLGGSRNKIVTDMTIGIDKPELMAQEARERVERDGFTILKVKAGICPQDDVRALTLIREAVGPHVRLRVDANQGYTVGDAVRTLKAYEKLGERLRLVKQRGALCEDRRCICLGMAELLMFDRMDDRTAVEDDILRIDRLFRHRLHHLLTQLADLCHRTAARQSQKTFLISKALCLQRTEGRPVQLLHTAVPQIKARIAAFRDRPVGIIKLLFADASIRDRHGDVQLQPFPETIHQFLTQRLQLWHRHRFDDDHTGVHLGKQDLMRQAIAQRIFDHLAQGGLQGTPVPVQPFAEGQLDIVHAKAQQMVWCLQTGELLPPQQVQQFLLVHILMITNASQLPLQFIAPVPAERHASAVQPFGADHLQVFDHL